MAFTEFYCNSSGSNVNAGSATTVIGGASNAAAYTATNGAWDKDSGSNEGTFTPASGNPSTTVSAGDFGAIYADGASVAAAVMLVKSVTSTTIVFDQTKFSGTIPTDAANGITCKVGGAWAGPAGGVGFPFDFVLNSLTNAAGDTPRVNLNGTFSITTALAANKAGPIRFQGYTTASGDLGKFTVDGGGTAINLLNLTGANVDIVDAIFHNTGIASGSNYGINLSTGGECFLERVVVHDVRLTGFYLDAAYVTLSECEAYACNLSNTANQAGFVVSSTSTVIRCISHDNTGSNSRGFYTAAAGVRFDHCIADTNGSDGFYNAATSAGWFISCDAYNNTGDGIELANSSAGKFYIENCNFVKNGTTGTGYGINGSGAGARHGAVVNCGFGDGVGYANASGTVFGLKSMTEIDSVTHTTGQNPWVDPGDGDFRITLSTAKNAGRGSFTQTQAGYGDPNATVAYNDIGAARHVDPAGGGGIWMPRARQVGV